MAFVTGLTVALLELAGALFASGQGLPSIPPAVDPFSNPVRGFLGLLATLALTVAAVAVAGTLLHLWQGRRARRLEAARLEQRLEAALRHAGSHGVSVAVRPRTTLRASPLVIEIAGTVPHPEARDLAVMVIRQETELYGPDVEIEERVAVLRQPLSSAA